MAKYEIPIVWESYKVFTVEAENLQEAATVALREFLNEPDENYLDDSFDIDGIVNENYPDEELNMSKVVQNL